MIRSAFFRFTLGSVLVPFSAAVSADTSLAQQSFIDLISSIRPTSNEAAEAKAKAMRIFSELYTEGDDSVRHILDTMASDLKYALTRPLIFPSTKENLVKATLNSAQGYLQTILVGQAHSEDKPRALTASLRTALRGTYGAFWRKIGTGIGIGLALLGLKYLYTKLSKANEQASKIVTTLSALNTPFNKEDPRALNRVCHAIAIALYNERHSEPGKPPSDAKILALRISEVVEMDKKNGTTRFNDTMRLIAHPEPTKPEEEQVVKADLATLWEQRANIGRLTTSLWDAALHQFHHYSNGTKAPAFKRSLIETLSSDRLYEALAHQETRRALANIIRQKMDERRRS